MPTYSTIVIENGSATDMTFFVFQEQASFVGLAEPRVWSNCLATGLLATQEKSGAQLIIALDRSIRVGATRHARSMGGYRLGTPSVSGGEIISRVNALQPVSLASAREQDEPANHVILTVDPLGLSAATHRTGLRTGAFGLQVPPFAAEHVDDLLCGNAMLDQNGVIVLSSFIAPPPNIELEISPVPVFYVRPGAAEVGQPVHYDTVYAARCDFTSGSKVITVHFNGDGTFEVSDTN
ncbi:hypothetical protein V6582_00130 (plasmid) [Agrobacterium vitis]|uniref:hypothetical protein n=1 Tax=Agrobacterium vitis TaxID=373 RepID=UPI0012E776A6|nr:hypothetical protein [Agrobacterium vitis]MVA27314.1 hypothetical protein [Agrobacterium vitis]